MRILLIVLLTLALTGCPPVPFTPVDPSPPPAPIEPAPVDPGFTAPITGAWAGTLESHEGFRVTLALTLEAHADGSVTGTATFPDERTPTVGQVAGTHTADGRVALTVVATDGHETITFTLAGGVIGNVFAGAVANLLGTTGAFALEVTP